MARPLFVGVDSIMAAFDRQRPDNAYYSFWQGNKLIYQYNGEDFDRGREILEQTLQAGEQNCNTDVFDIKFHAKLDDGYITTKSKIIGTVPGRPYDPNENNGSDPGLSGMSTRELRPGDLPAPVYHMLKRMEEQFGMEARLKALEEVKPVEVKEVDWFERISGLLSQPGITDLLGGLISPIVQRATGVPVNLPVNGADRMAERRPSPAAINSPMIEPEKVKNDQIDHSEENGTDFTPEENEIIDKALCDISEFCNPVDVLPKLVAFAKMDKAQFDWVLGILNKTVGNG